MAFLSLGLAGVTAILLAVFLNRDFPAAIERVANRLSAPATAVGPGTTKVNFNSPRTERGVARPGVPDGNAI